MIFADPVYLWIAAGVLPGLAVFFWWTWRRRREAIAVFVRSRLLAKLTVGVSEQRQLLKRVLAGVGAALVLLALAQPQWGFSEEETRSRGLDIIVALDTSRSMLAADLKPSRIERAKLAAQDLLALAKSDRLGLVAFAGSAYLQCPLTLDEEAFRQTLLQVDTDIIPQGGTAIAEAIDTATQAFSKEGGNHRILVLMTDGEDHEPGAIEAAKRAARDGVRIFTIGVGRPDGELLFTTDPYGNRIFIKDDQGNAVKSRLNEALLKDVAQAADGFYLPLQNARTMATLYQRGLAPLPRGEGTSRVVRRFKERFQWPLGLAIVVLVVELFIRDHRRGAQSNALARATKPGLKASVGAPLALMLLLAGLLQPQPLAAAASPDSARKLFDRQKYDQALSQYEELLKSRPNDPQLTFNAGTAAFRKGDLAGAAQHFKGVAEATSEDPALQQKAYYNLGTTECLLIDDAKDLPQKLTHAGEAAQNLEAAVRLDPRDERATNNLMIARRRLEELQKQMPKQPQKQSGKDDKKQDDEKKDDSQKQQSQAQDEKKDGQDPSKSDPSQHDPQQQQQQSKRDEQHQPEDQQQDAKAQDDRQQADAQKAGEKPGDEKQGQPGAGDRKEGEDAEDRAAALAGKMTPAMAEKLLDQQKGEEKAMLFRLLENKNKPRDRQFKNW